MLCIHAWNIAELTNTAYTDQRKGQVAEKDTHLCPSELSQTAIICLACFRIMLSEWICNQ